MLDMMSGLGIRVVTVERPPEWNVLSGYAFNSARLPERSEAFLEYLRTDLKLFGVSLTTWMQGLFLGGDEYVRGQRARLLLAEMAFEQVFNRCDVVLQGTPDAFDIIGFPLVAFPIGLAHDERAGADLPVGAMIGGQPYAEDRLCAVVAAYQAVTDTHRLRPPEPDHVRPRRSSADQLRLTLDDVERLGA